MQKNGEEIIETNKAILSQIKRLKQQIVELAEQNDKIKEELQVIKLTVKEQPTKGPFHQL